MPCHLSPPQSAVNSSRTSTVSPSLKGACGRASASDGGCAQRSSATLSSSLTSSLPGSASAICRSAAAASWHCRSSRSALALRNLAFGWRGSSRSTASASSRACCQSFRRRFACARLERSAMRTSRTASSPRGRSSSHSRPFPYSSAAALPSPSARRLLPAFLQKRAFFSASPWSLCVCSDAMPFWARSFLCKALGLSGCTWRLACASCSASSQFFRFMCAWDLLAKSVAFRALWFAPSSSCITSSRRAIAFV
mmetsp:Transcript_447/g.1386  ORF Transcript_447/g.1386 Transcript_447/m.1386 type:complete len:253 (+) Transcript_447:680-1438(+)